MKLNILVLHGYAELASGVARNTHTLKLKLEDIADLHYADGPAMQYLPASSPRPWWILDSYGYEMTASARWADTVWPLCILWLKQYDGIIGLSQGAAMAALLISMLNNPSLIPGFTPEITRLANIKFAILCSGFKSSYPPHGRIYDYVPANLPTLHTVDTGDCIVSAEKTIALQKLFQNSILISHNEGHRIPCGGDRLDTMKTFIENCTKRYWGMCHRLSYYLPHSCNMLVLTVYIISPDLHSRPVFRYKLNILF